MTTNVKKLIIFVSTGINLIRTYLNDEYKCCRCLVFIKWLHNYGRPTYRADHYIFAVVSFYLCFFSFFPSPNLSGCRLNVYHTSTHGVALVRI